MKIVSDKESISTNTEKASENDEIEMMDDKHVKITHQHHPDDNDDSQNKLNKKLKKVRQISISEFLQKNIDNNLSIQSNQSLNSSSNSANHHTTTTNLNFNSFQNSSSLHPFCNYTESDEEDISDDESDLSQSEDEDEDEEEEEEEDEEDEDEEEEEEEEDEIEAYNRFQDAPRRSLRIRKTVYHSDGYPVTYQHAYNNNYNVNQLSAARPRRKAAPQIGSLSEETLITNSHLTSHIYTEPNNDKKAKLTPLNSKNKIKNELLKFKYEKQKFKENIMDKLGSEESSYKSRNNSKDEEMSSEEEVGSDDMDYEYSGSEDEDNGKMGVMRHQHRKDDLFEIDKILAVRKSEKDPSKVEYHVKYKKMSYRKTEWLLEDEMEDASFKIQGFYKRQEKMEEDDEEDEDVCNERAEMSEDGVEWEWTQVDKIISHQIDMNGRYRYLVKWKGLEYMHATWENEHDLTSDEDKEAIKKYEKYSKLPEMKRRCEDAEIKIPKFKNDFELRDYQVESVSWMIMNWKTRTSCILADEMGLGKTAQAIAVLEYQRHYCNIRGPFLVVAPITTLGHWKREIESWTDMYVVLYHGSKEDMKMMEQYEFYYHQDSKKSKRYKFNVMLTGYETMLRYAVTFRSISWECLILDEAQKVKNPKSQTRSVISSLQRRWSLLMTGTPIQNNLIELYSFLNLMNEARYHSLSEFLDDFSGDPPSLEQIKELQLELKPILLRRMKEDVEQLPTKEEIVIWVEMTPTQHAYYKALYGNKIEILLQGANTKTISGINNLSMELRKVCNHPFQCDDFENFYKSTNTNGSFKYNSLEALIATSGKMVLMDKLLPKLKSEGHRVLIFSQFKILLDVLMDYLAMKKFNFEYISGDIPQKERQAAIDRFSKEDNDCFIFLLSTRAGGAGITLTTADTVIIYDSDWNPQNDLQAMARCHRIGQKKDVKVYRLITRDTYEQHLFEVASKKYGLEEAILGTLNMNTGNVTTVNDSKRILDLLKYGAHILSKYQTKDAVAFQTEDVDEILRKRTDRRQIGSKAGNTFSEVSFKIQGEVKAMSNQQYWQHMLPEAVEKHNQKVAEEAQEIFESVKTRSARAAKKKVNYCELPSKSSAAIPHESDDLSFSMESTETDSTSSDDVEVIEEETEDVVVKEEKKKTQPPVLKPSTTTAPMVPVPSSLPLPHPITSHVTSTTHKRSYKKKQDFFNLKELNSKKLMLLNNSNPMIKNIQSEPSMDKLVSRLMPYHHHYCHHSNLNLVAPPIPTQISRPTSHMTSFNPNIIHHNNDMQFMGPYAMSYYKYYQHHCSLVAPKGLNYNGMVQPSVIDSNVMIPLPHKTWPVTVHNTPTKNDELSKKRDIIDLCDDEDDGEGPELKIPKLTDSASKLSISDKKENEVTFSSHSKEAAEKLRELNFK